jgi:predicted phage baseplate assembly protein
VDAARYSRIAGTAGNSLRYDYDGDAGDTLRFGDGVFGALPDPGTNFTATYRSGGGSLGNVAADSITSIDPNDASKAGVISVTNPLPASGGSDPESLESIQRQAPQAFRAVQYRAVIPADYQAAAQTLPWVLRAGSVFRWTGSWLTAFTTPDPVASEQITATQRLQLINLLSQYRMAGYESYVTDPAYVSIDLVIWVCAQPVAFQGAVEQAVLTALGKGPGGFFAHDNFTFGQPLDKSTLEAAIQAISGVAGVLKVMYRFSGRTTAFSVMRDTVTVGSNQILRCDNDPSLPGNGSLQVIIMGGK